jgi:hypothetical protein
MSSSQFLNFDCCLEGFDSHCYYVSFGLSFDLSYGKSPVHKIYSSIVVGSPHNL